MKIFVLKIGIIEKRIFRLTGRIAAKIFIFFKIKTFTETYIEIWIYLCNLVSKKHAKQLKAISGAVGATAC